jgi:hypothetical protein
MSETKTREWKVWYKYYRFEPKGFKVPYVSPIIVEACSPAEAHDKAMTELVGRSDIQLIGIDSVSLV